MLKTEAQRRWWFATHPEYSRSPRGTVPRPDGPRLRLTGHPAADPDSYDQYEDAIERKEAYEREARELDKQGLIESHTALDVIPIGRSFKASELSFNWLLRRLGRGAVVYARKPKQNEGPGKWVEVRRSPLGLEHQSRMSGQPIRHEDGKFYIKEYEVQVEGRREPVRFDDFKDGVYYEYKGKQGNLIGKDGFFGDWCRAKAEAREEAERQVKAAQGRPLIWRVGADQRPAFDKEIGHIRGLLVKP